MFASAVTAGAQADSAVTNLNSAATNLDSHSEQQGGQPPPDAQYVLTLCPLESTPCAFRWRTTLVSFLVCNRWDLRMPSVKVAVNVELHALTQRSLERCDIMQTTMKRNGTQSVRSNCACIALSDPAVPI